MPNYHINISSTSFNMCCVLYSQPSSDQLGLVNFFVYNKLRIYQNFNIMTQNMQLFTPSQKIAHTKISTYDIYIWKSHQATHAIRVRKAIWIFNEIPICIANVSKRVAQPKRKKKIINTQIINSHKFVAAAGNLCAENYSLRHIRCRELCKWT